MGVSQEIFFFAQIVSCLPIEVRSHCNRPHAPVSDLPLPHLPKDDAAGAVSGHSHSACAQVTLQQPIYASDRSTLRDFGLELMAITLNLPWALSMLCSRVERFEIVKHPSNSTYLCFFDVGHFGHPRRDMMHLDHFGTQR